MKLLLFHVFFMVGYMAALCLAGDHIQVVGSKEDKPLMRGSEEVCHACHAIILEIERSLGSKRSEADVYDAAEGVCHKNVFNVYKFIPPTMAKACAVASGYMEDLEEELLDGGNVRERVCRDLCKGHSFEIPKPYQPSTSKPRKARHLKPGEKTWAKGLPCVVGHTDDSPSPDQMGGLEL